MPNEVKIEKPTRYSSFKNRMVANKTGNYIIHRNLEEYHKHLLGTVFSEEAIDKYIGNVLISSLNKNTLDNFSRAKAIHEYIKKYLGEGE